jgi:hypothetical protein
LVELINDYFVPFGAKPCCFSDLKLYLPLVPQQRVGELMKKLWQSSDLKENELPENVRLNKIPFSKNYIHGVVVVPNAKTHQLGESVSMPWNTLESQLRRESHTSQGYASSLRPWSNY